MFIDIANAAIAQTWNWWIFSQKMDAWEFILTGIAIFVLAAWIFSIIFILWGWLLLILSWWKDNKIQPAVNTIRYAVIWMVVTVATIYVFPILGRLLWLDVEKYAKPERIIQKIEDIGNNIFWKSTSSSSNSNSDNLNELPDDFSNL
jgi:hypothetical protein